METALSIIQASWPVGLLAFGWWMDARLAERLEPIATRLTILETKRRR